MPIAINGLGAEQLLVTTYLSIHSRFKPNVDHSLLAFYLVLDMLSFCSHWSWFVASEFSVKFAGNWIYLIHDM